MENNDPKRAAFRVGDLQRRKGTREAAPAPKTGELLRSYPFLEKLLESDETAVEQFQGICQSTCRSLDASLRHQEDPRLAALGQAALAAYGQSLKLFAELLEIKYTRLNEQAEQR